MANENPIRFGLTGLGGFAAKLTDRLLAEASSQHPLAILKTVCTRDVGCDPRRVQLLKDNGVAIVGSYDELLAQDIQAVWLPLPIDLHRPFTEAALRARKAVLCEKPAAGSVQDVDAMIAARDQSGQICAISYQDVYQPAVQELKRRLVKGDFGIVISGSVIGCWPRGEKYYHRNDWAGRISRDGNWILDSPANNAMAHYLHLALFLLGSSEQQSAVPREVEAELYRAYPIENYDTCSLRFTFDGGMHLLVGLTHACRDRVEPEVVIRTQTARICYRPRDRIEIQTQNVTETIRLLPDPYGPVLRTMHNWIHHGPDAARGGTLEMARIHTVAINAASEASPIVDIPVDQVQTVTDAEGSTLRAVEGIEMALQSSIKAGRMLHETGLVGWSRPAGDITELDYTRFRGPFDPLRQRAGST